MEAVLLQVVESSSIDWTAVLAGVAAATGVAGVVMNSVRQRNQQAWQADQEAIRRAWESDQDVARREWEKAQAAATRWDALKREHYVRFISTYDQLSQVQQTMSDLRRDLAEDFVNHLATIEQYYEEEDPKTLRRIEESGTAEEFWSDLHAKAKASALEEQEELRVTESQLKKALRDVHGEMRLTSPEHILGLSESLVSSTNEHHRWGRPWVDRQRLDKTRDDFVDAVRIDLQLPVSAAEQP